MAMLLEGLTRNRWRGASGDQACLRRVAGRQTWHGIPFFVCVHWGTFMMKGWLPKRAAYLVVLNMICFR